MSHHPEIVSKYGAGSVPCQQIILTAELILSDGKGWYLVKSENRLLGWAKEESILRSISDLPLAD
ncbi:MAG: hypothetical protein ACK40X_01775 [Armatimonadota bacterium]